MERNLTINNHDYRIVPQVKLTGDFDKGMTLERWEFQEILKEIAARSSKRPDQFSED